MFFYLVLEITQLCINLNLNSEPKIYFQVIITEQATTKDWIKIIIIIYVAQEYGIDWTHPESSGPFMAIGK